MKITNLLYICTLCFILTSCGISDTSSSSSISTNSAVTLSGQVVDGYVSGASVCLDLDFNGECGISEPTSTTTSNGTFNFGSKTMHSGELISYVSSGGVDSATGKKLEGKLRSIFEFTSSGHSYVTPLTDLIAKNFLDTNTRDLTNLRYSKEVIARAFPIHIDVVEKSPAAYAGVFARTQEIQQLKGLLSKVFEVAKAIALTTSQKTALQEIIKSAIVKDIATSTEPNVLNIISLLESDENLTIKNAQKTFVNEQYANIKVALESFAANTNLSELNLNTYQVELEKKADIAYAMIDGNGTMASFPLKIDIFSIVADANATVPPDTNATSPTNEIVVNFSGVSVDGYLSGADLCLDLNYDGKCSAKEASSKTDTNGVFKFSKISLQKDTLFPIISSGGTDLFSTKPYTGKLKNIVVANDLANANLIISPLTDLMSMDFLKQTIKNKSTLITSQTNFATKMGVSAQVLFSDPTKDTSLFMKSLYIEYIKRVIGFVAAKRTTPERIKYAILAQILDGGYKNLLVSRILDNTNVDFTNQERDFVENILKDIKVVLDDAQTSTDVGVYTLPTLQRKLEDTVEPVLSSKVYTPITIPIKDVVASNFDKKNATYDILACELNSINKNKLTDNNTTDLKQEDTTNGIGVKSYGGDISVYYPDLNGTLSTTSIYKYLFNTQDYFSFDEVWATQKVDIYIQTPKDAKGIFGCYKAKLDSTYPANISLKKVFRYSY